MFSFTFSQVNTWIDVVGFFLFQTADGFYIKFTDNLLYIKRNGRASYNYVILYYNKQHYVQTLLCYYMISKFFWQILYSKYSSYVYRKNKKIFSCFCQSWSCLLILACKRRNVDCITIPEYNVSYVWFLIWNNIYQNYK